MALVEAGGAIDEMALMLQREVAERVAAAAPGCASTAACSVLTQIACDVRLAFARAARRLQPAPQVELGGDPSAPSRHATRADPPSPRASARVVRAAFAQRRKNLANAACGLASAAAPSVLASASPRPASTPAAARRDALARRVRAPGRGARRLRARG